MDVFRNAKYSFHFAKVVDDALHMANHVRESCERDYPKVFKEVQENLDSPNREAAEQTFVWPGQSKKNEQYEQKTPSFSSFIA